MTQTTKTYSNPDTGYWVTLVDNGNGAARVTDSLAYSFPMAGADYPFAALLASSRAAHNGAVEVPAAPAPAQIVSPLAPAAQVAPSNLATGATLIMPTLPQARCLAYANWSVVGTILRGPVSATGRTAPFTQFIAMRRRGWFTISEDRTMALITDTGKRALARYIAQNGPVA
ncbi:MAG: hypothetical protein V4515_14535 [Chloroflexota bacterium]